MKQFEDDPQTKPHEDNAAGDGSKYGIGAGKKFGFYGCVFFFVAGLLIVIVLILAARYVAYSGSYGVGP